MKPAFVLANGLADFNHANVGCSGEIIDVRGTAFFAQQAGLLAELCRLADDAECEAQATGLAADAAVAFRAHLTFANGSVGSGSQDELVFALALGLLATPEDANATARLLGQLMVAAGHVDTGALGTWLLRHVFSFGLGPHVWAWLISSRQPSYGYFLNNGYQNATTMFEHWGTPEENTSHNHAWLNSVSLLFRSHLLGLRPALEQGAAGFGHVVVQPWPVMPAAAAAFAGSLDTARGTVSVAWAMALEADAQGLHALTLNVTAPPNVQVTVMVPFVGAAPVARCPGAVALGTTVDGGIAFASFDMSFLCACTFASSFVPPDMAGMGLG